MHPVWTTRLGKIEIKPTGTENDNNQFICRYCCKSNAMFRPQAISFFESMIPPVWPIGPIIVTVKAVETVIEEVYIKIYNCFSTAEPNTVHLK